LDVLRRRRDRGRPFCDVQIAVGNDRYGSIASVRQCPPLVRSPTNSNHSWRIQTSLWCNLPVHSKSSNCGTVFGVLNPRDIPTRCLPLEDFAEPVAPGFQDSLFPLHQIGAHVTPRVRVSLPPPRVQLPRRRDRTTQDGILRLHKNREGRDCYGHYGSSQI
jgi:hypothetical protein